MSSAPVNDASLQSGSLPPDEGPPSPPTIVIAGLAGAGKTAFLQATSEPAGLVSAVHRRAAGRMLRCELGHVTLRGAAGVRLLALPDDPDYRLTDALPPSLLGVVFLVNSADPIGLPRARELIAGLLAAETIPVVVAATGAGGPGALSPQELRHHLRLPVPVPLAECARLERSAVQAVLILLLHHVIDRMGDRDQLATQPSID